MCSKCVCVYTCISVDVLTCTRLSVNACMYVYVCVSVYVPNFSNTNFNNVAVLFWDIAMNLILKFVIY